MKPRPPLNKVLVNVMPSNSNEFMFMYRTRPEEILDENADIFKD